MSDHVARSSHDEEATSSTSSRSHQPSWISHWMNKTSKPASVVNNSSSISNKEGHVDQKSCFAQCRLMVEDGFPKPLKGASEHAEERVGGMINDTKRIVGIQNKTSNSPLTTLSLCHNMENTSTRLTPIDHFGHKNMSLALAVDKVDTARDFDLLGKNNSSSSETRVLSNSYNEQKGIAVSRFGADDKAGPSCIPPDQSNFADASSSGVVYKRHISNDRFKCLDQGHCKYQKFSTFLFHEKMKNDLSHEMRQGDGLHMQDNSSMNKNFLPFFLKKQSESIQGHSNPGLFSSRKSLSDIEQKKLYHGCQTLDRVPCSVHNVETMRICTMVDSVEDSPGGTPKISQRSHHFLFTKETCVNLSERHQVLREPTLSAHCKEKTFGGSFSLSPAVVSSQPQGVKIQPLWSSTDSEEKENTGNPLTSKASSRNESSAETDSKQTNALKRQHILSGMASSSLNKNNAMDETIPPATFISRTEETSSKRPIVEIPDINEELPDLQPGVSSTDSMEPSASRVHSLDAKHLFPCGEVTSRSGFNVHQEPAVGPETSNRWIKRLKRSYGDSLGVGTKSSEVGDASSHEKFSVFFNRIMKCNRETADVMLSQHHGKEQMTLDQNLESLRNNGSSSMGSKDRNQSMMSGCSWIQRWRQRSTAPPLNKPEPLVICEPHSLKVGQDELPKKQFPSIAAMALMGKAMNGFRPCEFRKSGPVVVWNTKDY